MNTQALLAGGEPPALDLNGIRVLVVEDDDDSREMMASVLSECHATVSTAGSGEQALRIVAEGNLDVLVSDIGLPDMDGYALIQQIRAVAKGWLPAIALTGHDGSIEAHRALVAGFQVHVGKPADAWMLAHAVVNVVDMTPMPPEA